MGEKLELLKVCLRLKWILEFELGFEYCLCVVGVCCCVFLRLNLFDWKVRDEEMMRKERKKKGVSFIIFVVGDDGWSFLF